MCVCDLKTFLNLNHNKWSSLLHIYIIRLSIYSLLCLNTRAIITYKKELFSMNASWLIFLRKHSITVHFSVYFFLLPPPSLIRLVLNYILNYDETCYGWVVLHINFVLLLTRVRFPVLIFITLRLTTLNYRAKKNCLGHKLLIFSSLPSHFGLC